MNSDRSTTSGRRAGCRVAKRFRWGNRVALGLLAGWAAWTCLGPHRVTGAAPEPGADAENRQALGPGDHTRKLQSGGTDRDYLLHVPSGYRPESPAPLVLALHGAGMNGSMMERLSGLNRKADEAGFLVAYPSGTGMGPFRVWNAGGFEGRLAESRPDDVAFISQLIDDVKARAAVDDKRIYATGMSNGGMMCYRLAVELADRIAAIAPVAGTMAIAEGQPCRPVPVMHIHGRQDKIVPFEVRGNNGPPFIKLKGVEDSIQIWLRLNGCQEAPMCDMLSRDGDEMRVSRAVYGGGKDGTEVVLVVVEEGGHTWPGRQPPLPLLGKSAMNISATDLIWDFFRRYRLP
jgi:polyhydroxybutyrate depolymerase